MQFGRTGGVDSSRQSCRNKRCRALRMRLVQRCRALLQSEYRVSVSDLLPIARDVGGEAGRDFRLAGSWSVVIPAGASAGGTCTGDTTSLPLDGYQLTDNNYS